MLLINIRRPARYQVCETPGRYAAERHLVWVRGLLRGLFL